MFMAVRSSVYVYVCVCEIVCVSVCACVCVSVCVSASLSVCLFAYMTARLPISLPVCVFEGVCMHPFCRVCSYVLYARPSRLGASACAP